MKRRISLAAGFICAALLAVSCVIPEKFNCDINITKNGTYSVKLNGTLVFHMVFEEIKTRGNVSGETDSQVKAFFDEAVKEESAITKYEYQNNGRAYIEYFKEVTDGSSLNLSDAGLPLVINGSPDGSVTVRVSAPDSDERDSIEEYSQYGYKLDGTIVITSELPIIDAGNEKVGSKYLFFGPKVIKRTITMSTLPAEDIVIKAGQK